jgi:hypothetical protein
MWRLFLSGLFCVPALLLLAVAAPHDRAWKVVHKIAAPSPEDAIVAPSPALARPESPAITISLPPTPFLMASVQTDLDGWEIAASEHLVIATAVYEQPPTHPKAPRVSHQRAARHDASPTVVAQATLQAPQDTFWTRLARWLVQHEAPKVWSPAAGEGAG